MSTIIMVCMTSGIEGPRGELTGEQSRSLAELVSRLMEPWTGSELASLGGLGADHYLVQYGEDPVVFYVRTNASGFVSTWRQGDTDWHNFNDTVGLRSFLSFIAAPIIQKWIQKGQREMDEYNEKMFGASK